jgi:hypothetical protein
VDAVLLQRNNWQVVISQNGAIMKHNQIDGIKIEPDDCYLVEIRAGHMVYEQTSKQAARVYLRRAQESRNVDVQKSYRDYVNGHHLIMFAGSYSRLSVDDIKALDRPTGVTGILRTLEEPSKRLVAIGEQLVELREMDAVHDDAANRRGY